MAEAWVLGLVAAVERYEDEHAKGDRCLKSALDQVPKETRQEAAGYADAVHEIGKWFTSGKAGTQPGNEIIAKRLRERFAGYDGGGGHG